MEQSGFAGDIGLYSYGAAMLAYALLSALALYTRRNNPMGNLLATASILTTLWAASVVASGLMAEPQLLLIQVTEVLRNAGWTFALFRLVTLIMRDSAGGDGLQRWHLYLTAFYLAALVLIPLTETRLLSLDATSSASLVFGTWLGMAVVGLLLLEQYFRNSTENENWATKHLCIGLGIIFIYDFFMYAEALLFQNLDRNFWQARGGVVAMAGLLMAISMNRTKRAEDYEAPRLYLSRHVAFHSLTLMVSGIYLISMALAAYFIRYLGGSWGGVLQITFLVAAGLTLIVLLFSGQIRASMRVWLSKNFFSYKYDYRTEWLQFTGKLATGHSDIPLNITKAIAELAKSPGGILWGRSGSNEYLSVLAHWEMPRPASDTDLGELPAWLQEKEWIIDLAEWRDSPDLYQGLILPETLQQISRAWLVIPLLFGDRLQGILLLKESELMRELNWEDRDLLKVAGRQAASHLAQYQADQALVESRQFEAFNRLSAYVIHDLKNILAQLSLVVSNAEKHKQNPAFINDMVDTVNNSVVRMTKLMAQLRSDSGVEDHGEVDLKHMLREVVRDSSLREPSPELDVAAGNYLIHCDRERLHAVFGHLIHNAQDATDKQGTVQVRLDSAKDSFIVEIEDNGEGMDELFVQHRLFKPFDSTKGLTGMGIGAFESRDFIRSLGGDINVKSAPGEGSLFTVRIPDSSNTRTTELKRQA